MDVFVYGTLMKPETVEAVTSRRFLQEPGTLRGYRRFEPPQSYPYIRPYRGAVTRGVILLRVDAQSLRLLDAYEGEGDLYFREKVTVEAGGVSRSCATYVGNPAALPRLRML